MASTPRIVHAETLRDRLQAALNDADLTGATASLDARDIPSGARHGIVIVAPPDMTFPTFTQTEITHELAVIAGPADNLLKAWERLDAMVEAIRRAGFDLDAARGDMFKPLHGSPLPGYTLTLNPETVIDESETP